MALSKEDLLAIKGVVDESVSDLKEDVGGLKTRMDVLEKDVKGLKEDVGVLKEDVGVLKEDVSGLKEDVGVLKEDVSELKEDVSTLKTEMKEVKGDIGVLNDKVDTLNTEMQEVKGDVTKIRVVQIENLLIPSVNEIIEYQKSTYDRYNKGAELFEEKIVILDALENVVKTHSEQIQELQRKQA